eukprot:1151305-Alexandrium_andersonii.AAC.1
MPWRPHTHSLNGWRRTLPNYSLISQGPCAATHMVQCLNPKQFGAVSCALRGSTQETAPNCSKLPQTG